MRFAYLCAKRIRVFLFMMVASLTILTCAVHAQTIPLVPATGVYCWNAPTTNTDGTPLTDQATLKYKTYLTPPNGVQVITDLGVITSAPTPPTPAQACPVGAIGVTRVTSTTIEGTYSWQLTAYRSDPVNGISESPKSIVVQFTVKFKRVPGAPLMLIVK